MKYTIWLTVVIVAVSVAQAQRPATRLPDGTTAHRDLEYVKGGHERQRLDLYTPEKADGPLPVIVWVHGGGWMGGSKDDGVTGDRFRPQGIRRGRRQLSLEPARCLPRPG